MSENKTRSPRLVISSADAAKLERIWKDHAPTVLAMLKTFCANPEDARDTLQELFLRIGKNPAVVESSKSPRAFLIVAARRIAIDVARKRTAEQTRLESPDAVEALHPVQGSIKNDPELEAAISGAVQNLPPEQRSVFIAKIIQRKTLAVIAAEQNITLNTAASRLRYSLDKIRSQLRPHYEAMNNQTNKPTNLSDSSERLIKPLEPKRVPSVAVDCIFLPPPQDEIEIAYCDPMGGGNAWENDGTPTAVELPLDSSENEAEPEILDEETDGQENVTGDLSDDASGDEEPAETPEVVICEQIDFSEQTAGQILEEVFDDEAATDDVDWSVYACWNDLFDGEVKVVDDSSEDNGDLADWDLDDYYNDLLKEYDAFLAENPDWITENSGGDMHAQVITPSQYTGLELADPGAARAFDLWFEKNYLNCDYQQDGSLLLSGENHTYGTEISYDQYNGSFIPPEWLRGGNQIMPMPGAPGGALNLTGTPYETDISVDEIRSTGVPKAIWRADVLTSANDLTPTHDDGGAQNLTGTPYETDISMDEMRSTGVPKALWRADALNSTNDAEENLSLQEDVNPSSSSLSEQGVAENKQESGSVEVSKGYLSATPVTPIVSGSEEVIESPAGHRQMIAEMNTPSFDQVELPTLVNTKADSAAEDSGTTDDIAFTDDDSFVPATTGDANPVAATPSNAPAKTDVAAAVGGAFAAGTATQAAPTRGGSGKK